MRNANGVLDIIRSRGSLKLPLEDVYRQLFNPDLYLLAYGNISANHGALTPGVTDETADGMSLKKIQAVIESLRYERFRWTPVRRIYIEKKRSTKKRPLGLPTWRDKLVQEVLRLILEAYYDPQFSPRSHGFRPKRGCHTAIDEIYRTWRGTGWFIEGDISACFDSLDHQVLLSILGERIHDNRFLRLIDELLKAGYLEDWKYNATRSGAPQGGVVSPILSNIYLDRLDQFVETLLPTYNRGRERKLSSTYRALLWLRGNALQRGKWAEAHQLLRQMQLLPSREPKDPNYRRLRYIRYADDILLGFAGPRSEAEDIKQAIGTFLRDQLKLELSEAKTLITHGRSESARFLGYDIHVLHANARLTRGYRSINGAVGLKVPREVVMAACSRYMRDGKPIHRRELQNDSVFDVIIRYAQEYRGLVAYYRPAYNLHQFGRLRWTMETSLVKTLAAKLRCSAFQVYRKHRTTVKGRKALQVTVPREGKRPLVATWGTTDLVRRTGTTFDDTIVAPLRNPRSELVQRLLADTCELCGSQDRIEVHHIRALRDLRKPGRPAKPAWVQFMAGRQRKTLVVCHTCHRAVHAGRVGRNTNSLRVTGEPDAVKVARPVRRGADGKVPAIT